MPNNIERLAPLEEKFQKKLQRNSTGKSAIINAQLRAGEKKPAAEKLATLGIMRSNSKSAPQYDNNFMYRALNWPPMMPRDAPVSRIEPTKNVSKKKKRLFFQSGQKQPKTATKSCRLFFIRKIKYRTRLEKLQRSGA